MKVNVLFLDYERHDHTERALKSIREAGYPFDLTRIDMKGIARAINFGIYHSVGEYDAIVTAANDIIMPPNWLDRMVEAAQAIPNTGMCGIHCVEGQGDTAVINGVKVHTICTSFGNVLIPMSAIEKVGYFNEDYDPYGMQDADFAHRLNATGHINYYLDGLKAEHIGHDVGQPSAYRQMKDEGLSVAGDKWGKWSKLYADTGDYTINMPEWLQPPTPCY